MHGYIKGEERFGGTLEFRESSLEDLVVYPLFWKNRKVLITGHTGFKGSWLSLWLQRMGAHVTGYALPSPSDPSLFELAQVSGRMESIVGDVRDLEHLTAVISKQRPEIIVHMAAQALVRHSYSSPVETYATNVMGTVNILEANRRTKCAKVMIIVTSDKCYENREWLWGYRENDPMGGNDPYSNSKGCAELVTSAYRNSFFPDIDYSRHGVAIASARAGNVIGGGDWARDRIIPDIMRAFIEKRPVIIRSPNAVRPWQHVLDPLHGYLCLSERLWERGPEFGGGWNFGPDDGDTRPVSWLVETLIDLWGEGAGWEMDKDINPQEAHCLKLDCSKAKSLLAWSTRLDLDTALRWTVDWYRAYQQKEDMRGVTEAEIARFEEILTEGEHASPAVQIL